MKYAIKDSRVVESHRISYSIKPLNILITLALLAPGSLLITYASINSWTYPIENNQNALNWQGPIGVILFLVLAYISLGMIFVEKKYWAVRKHPKAYQVYGLKTKYKDLPVYKEAVADVIADIKAGRFEEDRWNFYNLNDEAERFERKQKELNRNIIPPKDYAQVFKDFNDQYFGEEDKLVRKLPKKSAG